MLINSVVKDLAMACKLIIFLSFKPCLQRLTSTRQLNWTLQAFHTALIYETNSMHGWRGFLVAFPPITIHNWRSKIYSTSNNSLPMHSKFGGVEKIKWHEIHYPELWRKMRNVRVGVQDSTAYKLPINTTSQGDEKIRYNTILNSHAIILILTWESKCFFIGAPLLH